VQNLLRKRHVNFFSSGAPEKISRAPPVRALSRTASLDRARGTRTIPRFTPSRKTTLRIVADDVKRFEQSIAGRAYLIEVSPVSEDRWRAHIVRLPGLPSAMMPFYGRTPAEAAAQLSAWLTRAHERATALSSGGGTL
jgi:hypothetical protein